MIAIIDYKMGNLRSVKNALSRLGAEYTVTDDAAAIVAADKVLLPGVGYAAQAMANLRERGLVDVIRGLRKPVLGICIGMQVLCRYSEEGDTPCLDVFDTDVRRFKASEMSKALSDTGNTRFPRSVFSGTPRPSKNAMVDWLLKREKAL